MKKHLLLGLLALAGARSACAIFQFDVELSDLDSVDCWNAVACSATAATVHMYNPANPADERTINCNIFGPAGQPLVYQFQADADAQINCAVTYIIDALWASYDGPGFHYEFTHVPPPFTMFYQCGPGFPIDIDAPAGDGCIPFDPGFEWTFENFPSGRVDLTEDFTIPAEESLYIAAGMQVYGLPGCGLTIEGDIFAEGTIDNWIEFTGDNWDGITFANDAEQQADLYYCKIHHVNSADDGGAVTVNTGAVANLFHCLVAHNECAGNGAAAYVGDGGSLSIYYSTVSHNMGTTAGGIFLGGGSALFTSGMNLVTFNTPENTDFTGTGAVPNVFFTNFYPQQDGFPDGMILPVWYCDPGYVNPAEMDFHISYWSLADPDEVNCIIDVSVNELENDPDGTPGDMGAFPFDQHAILNAAEIVAVTDRPNDQGGFVIIEFAASPNDGSWMNPVTMYSVWMQYPGMGEDEWVSAGTVAAIADPDMHYFVQVPTLDDQYEGNENIHNFMIGTHSVHFPIPVPSEEMTGFSLDNIAPAAVTGTEAGNWYYDQWPPLHDVVDFSWDASPANDFNHFKVYAGTTDVFDDAELIYTGVETETSFSISRGSLEHGDLVHYWVEAVDNHLNTGPHTHDTTEFTDDVTEALPAVFSLGQNYPNPFNPTTSIDFALPVPGHVTLGVYNILGGKVATLVSGTKAAGRYTVTFDGGQLASGVYFYKLEAPDFSDMKKMILVK